MTQTIRMGDSSVSQKSPIDEIFCATPTQPVLNKEYHSKLMEEHKKELKKFLAIMNNPPNINETAGNVLANLEYLLPLLTKEDFHTFYYEVQKLFMKQTGIVLGVNEEDETDISARFEAVDKAQREIEKISEEIAGLKEELDSMTR